MLLFIAAFVTLVCLFACLCYKLHFVHGHDAVTHLNHPPFVPVFGLLFEIVGHTTLGDSELTRKMRKWQQIYKSPMLVKAIGTQTVQLYAAPHTEQLMKSRVNIAKADSYRLLECWMGKGLLTSAGKDWHRQRKLLTPAFHFQVLKDYLPCINAHAIELVEWFRRESADDIDVRKPFTLATLDIICEAAMGKKLDALKSAATIPYVEAVLRFSDIFMYRVVRSWFKYDWIFHTFSPLAKQLRHDLHTMHSFSRQVIEDGAVNFSTHSTERNGKLAFLDLLLALKESGQMTIDDIQEQVDTFIFEGHDTTATALVWICACLGNYPEIQAIIQEELDEIFASEPKRMPNSEDLSRMTFLEMAIKETLRLYPSVPIISRTLECPLTISEANRQTTLPENMRVGIHLVSLHRNSIAFPDPEKFDPNRFSANESSDRHPLSFMPFSAGPRNCIGQKFAMQELLVVMSSILRNFTLEAQQKHEDLDPVFSLVFRPTKPVKIRFRERV